MAQRACPQCRHRMAVHGIDGKCMYTLSTGHRCLCSVIETGPRFEMGYHTVDIPKGVLGEASKIEEEFLEFMDACRQNASVMQLCELADMIGAIRAWLARHHPSIDMDDLVRMSDLTERAFTSGKRK